MKHPLINQLRKARFGATLLSAFVWGILGASASTAPSNPVVTLAPVAGSNTLNIAITATGSVRYDLGFPIGTVNIPINSSDSETAQLGGTQTLALEAIFNAENQGTVTGVDFTDGNIQVLNTLNWQLGLGSYLGFAIGNVYVTGTNLAGRFYTPNPMSAVSGGTTFQLADHELILDGGNLTGHATGRASGSIAPFDIDLAVSPISGPLAATGTGSVTLSSPTVVGNTVSYTVTATVPMNFSYLLMTDPVDVTVAITGTTQWQGILTRPLPEAPVFTEIPLDQTVSEGDSVTFTAQATGSPTPLMTWHFIDSSSVDHTLSTVGNTLMFASHPADAGRYYAVASNSVATVNSTPAAVLTVKPNIVVNGDFSANAASFTQGNSYFGAQSPGNPESATGWTGGSGINGTLGTAPDYFGPANHSIPSYLFMQGTQTVTQTITTTAGMDYRFSFKAACREFNTVGLKVCADHTKTPNLTIPDGGLSGTSFQTYSFIFTGSGTQTIQFVNSGTGDFTADVTDVSVTELANDVIHETDLSYTGGSFPLLDGNNLIRGNAGSSALSITTSPDATGGASALTDGNLGAPQTAGLLGIEGGSITYDLGSGANGTGYNIAGIRSLTAWVDGGRIQPKYTFSYSVDGLNFTPLGTVNYSTATGNGADVTLAISGVTSVRYVRFDFSGGQQNGWVSYRELAVFGTSSKSPYPTPTQTALSASPNPSTPGTSVTFTATVLDAGVTAVNATGNVVFLIDGADVATSVIANGVASYTISTLAGGAHTITAVYSGDAGYATSTTSLTQTIYLPPAVTETDLSPIGGSFALPGVNNLILGNAGTSTLTTVTYTGTAANLTDGVLQAPGSPGTSSSIVMIQNGTVTYSLGNGSAGLGFTLTGIRSLTAWTNNTRINPKYTVSYSEDGITFMPLATVSYAAPTGAKGTDVALAITGLTHVKYLQFTFPNTQQNSGVAYSELAAYGTDTPAVPLSLDAQILLPAQTSVVINLNGLVTGHSYTVQSSPSLAPDSWSDEVTFTATQATAAFTYPMGGNARRFYRLQY